MVDSSGVTRLFGLTALHITTKDLPNWFWATFESVYNPGRCDYMGCSDCFGTMPAFVPSNICPPTGTCPPTAVGQIYPPGTMTPGLDALFAKDVADDRAGFLVDATEQPWTVLDQRDA